MFRLTWAWPNVLLLLPTPARKLPFVAVVASKVPPPVMRTAVRVLAAEVGGVPRVTPFVTASVSPKPIVIVFKADVLVWARKEVRVRLAAERSTEDALADCAVAPKVICPSD